MPDSLGGLDDRLSMLDFLGSSRFVVPGESDGALRARGATGTVPALDVGGLSFGGTQGSDVRTFIPPNAFLGFTDDRWIAADVWFELAIVRPFTIIFGNILSTQNADITVYSSFRNQDINLTSVVNNLGSGATLSGLPSIPAVIGAQSGFTANLEVTTDGPPTINDTIDFVFDVGTQSVAVEGSRIVLLPVVPEVPLNESLEFLTDILEHIDGSEQRIADRKNPRQVFDFRFILDGNDRRFLENIIYDWQGRVFGIPIWTEPTAMTSAALTTALTINVEDTTLSDYRVGGLAIILTDRFTFDALEIASITASTLTFTSPLANDYPAGTVVYPLRTAVTTARLRGSRPPVNEATLDIRFRVLDNDVGDSFGDASAFDTYNSKIFLNDPNAVGRRMTTALQTKLVEFDNETGKQSVTGQWSRARRSSMKGFITHNRQELWDVRKLLHALKGKQIPFYLPTFDDEMELTVKLQTGSQILNIVNIGFTQFAKSRLPSRAILRVIQTDGTILERNITSSGEIDPENEQIVVDVAWASDVEIEDVSRIEYVELVRADTDKFRIEHGNALGEARIMFPVKAVFE